MRKPDHTDPPCILIDGKMYRPGELISVTEAPQRYTQGGWKA